MVYKICIYFKERMPLMNQPTREEFDQLAERVTRIEQRTEEIKAVRVEVASEDVVNRLKALEWGQKEFKQEATKKLDSVQEDANVLKIQMEGVRADILRVGESQADLRDRLIEHGQRLSSIEAKQDAHTEVLGRLVNFAESHDAMLKNMATKEDRVSMATKDDIQATREDIGRLEGIMMQILNRMPKTEGEW